MTEPTYRREIDGLRSLAVLPVMAFHAGFSAFGGGYIGVDIFFVISGFLITGIIARELDGGTFSLLRFYERRARRILPALLAVCAVTTAFAWALLLPQQSILSGSTKPPSRHQTEIIGISQESGESPACPFDQDVTRPRPPHRQQRAGHSSD